MRLVFAGASNANDVTLFPGELSLGASAACDVSLQEAGWLPHHADISLDPKRGLWLRLAADAGVAHVNARPVHECAMLRLGDIVTLGDVQFSVMLDEDDGIVRKVPSARRGELGEAERAAASRAVLRGVLGPYHGRAFSLAEGFVIGSASDADIRIDEADVAPRHAQMELHKDRVILRAMGKGNHVRVNGVTIENAILHPGDQLNVGSHRFTIEAPGLPPRGGGEFAPRSRPITQTRPYGSAETADGADSDSSAQPESQGGFNAVWLLLSASLIALVLAAILIYAPR